MKECCNVPSGQSAPTDQAYRKVLWICLVINAVMFGVEIVSGLASGSVSLQADALDFLGDAANYGISLYVLGKAVRVRAYSSLAKSGTMLVFGVWVLAQAVYKIISGVPPVAEVMGVVGFIALASNMFCFYMLSRHARDDSNRMSVWLCSRNDSIGNIAVMLAAVATYYTASYWPDLLVAAVLAWLAIAGSYRITRKAIHELQHPKENV